MLQKLETSGSYHLTPSLAAILGCSLGPGLTPSTAALPAESCWLNPAQRLANHAWSPGFSSALFPLSFLNTRGLISSGTDHQLKKKKLVSSPALGLFLTLLRSLVGPKPPALFFLFGEANGLMHISTILDVT